MQFAQRGSRSVPEAGISSSSSLGTGGSLGTSGRFGIGAGEEAGAAAGGSGEYAGGSAEYRGPSILTVLLGLEGPATGGVGGDTGRAGVGVGAGGISSSSSAEYVKWPGGKSAADASCCC